MSQKKPTTMKAEPGQLDTTLTREFDVPRELVFRVLCDGAAMPKYWNEDSQVEQFDTRTGGSWDIVVSPKNGWETRFHGVYHDVVSPGRIVRTFEMQPGKATLKTYTFEDLGAAHSKGSRGRTKMTLQTLYQSVADRATVMQYGLERYAGESHDQLEALFASRK